MAQVVHLKTTQHLNSKGIDQLIAMEMQYFKNVCMTEEENYIREELAKNPIDVSKRLMKSNQEQTEQQPPEQSEREQLQKYQSIEQYKRSQACRRSRLNRKMRIMKTKYRYDFMTEKLKLTTHYLEYIRAIIAEMELQLVQHGFVTTKYLHYLRSTFKIYHPDSNDSCESYDV